MFLLIFGLLRGNSEGWSSAEIVGVLSGSAALLLAFVAIELLTAEPLLDVRLFRIPAFTGASIAALSISAGLFAMLLYFVLYLQNVLGYSPLQTGVRLLPIHAGRVLLRSGGGEARRTHPAPHLPGRRARRHRHRPSS